MSTKKRTKVDNSIQIDHYNEVYLCGRVTSEGIETQLPSGDIACEFRIVVDREKSRGDKKEVDSIDVVVWSAGLRKKVRSLVEGDILQIEGAIRRRFWQGAHGVASRWQIEASTLEKVEI